MQRRLERAVEAGLAISIMRRGINNRNEAFRGSPRVKELLQKGTNITLPQDREVWFKSITDKVTDVLSGCV